MKGLAAGMGQVVIGIEPSLLAREHKAAHDGLLVQRRYGVGTALHGLVEGVFVASERGDEPLHGARGRNPIAGGGELGAGAQH